MLDLKHMSKGSVSKTYESADHGDGHYTFTSVRADLKGMHQVRYGAGSHCYECAAAVCVCVERRPSSAR